jgi:hypothetical protein
MNRGNVNRILVLAAFLAASLRGSLHAADEKDVSLEDKTKAVFIYNFTRYIEWPEADSSDDFIIGVVGESRVIEPLRQIQRIKKVGRRPIQVAVFDSTENVGDCEILFISGSENDRLAEVLKAVPGKGVLTVGDSKGYAHRGVAVNFIVVQGKIKFEVNKDALDRTDLRVSSHLLKLAKLIEGGKKK